MRRQRGSIVWKGNSCFIKYRDGNGKQKMEGSRPGQGFRSQAEAQARLNEVLDQIVKGDYVGPKTITFVSFAEQWIGDRISIKGSTASAYASIIRQHCIPHLGKLRVHEIGLDTLQGLVSKLAGKLSCKSLRNAITLLRVMLVGKKGPSAIKLGYIRHDPTTGLELPPMQACKLQPPSTEQVWKLVETAEQMGKQSKCARFGQALIFIDAFTGLRRGEILALEFSDIDWFASELVVSRAISKVKGDDGVHKWLWRRGETKNGKIRRIGIGPKVLRLLADLKQAATDPEGLVFTSEMAGLTGGGYPFIDPDFFNSSIFGPIGVTAELGDIRFHDLRHFFASMLIAQGESAKYVCDQMGHSSIQVTFDTYGHLFPQARKEASTKLEESMFKGRKEQVVENLVERHPDMVRGLTARKRAN
jgi:integrase